MSGHLRAPLATQEAIALEPAPFAQLAAGETETWFLDWRVRLTRNLARRSDGRWDPLTRVSRESR